MVVNGDVADPLPPAAALALTYRSPGIGVGPDEFGVEVAACGVAEVVLEAVETLPPRRTRRRSSCSSSRWSRCRRCSWCRPAGRAGCHCDTPGTPRRRHCRSTRSRRARPEHCPLLPSGSRRRLEESRRWRPESRYTALVAAREVARGVVRPQVEAVLGPVRQAGTGVARARRRRDLGGVADRRDSRRRCRSWRSTRSK